MIVVPRPYSWTGQSGTAIPAPTEAAFTSAFGALLLPAHFLETTVGKAAFYSLPPSSEDFSPSPSVPVILLHGVQTPALGLFPLAHALRELFPHTHFVLIDLWGHGLSDTPMVPHTPSLFYQLLEDLLDHLSWPLAHLIGFSFGSTIAAKYLAELPERVRSLVLIAPAGLIRLANFASERQVHFRDGKESVAHAWISDWLEGPADGVPETWEQKVANGDTVAPAVRAWQKREHRGHVASVVAMLRDGGAMDNHAVFAKAAGSGVPSLVILGELDDVCTAQELQHLGFANVYTVAQAGHGVVRERVLEVATLIGDFWNGQWARP